MVYEDWEASVPESICSDPLWRMRVYRLSLFLQDIAWRDVTKLVRDRRTPSTADQLYRAVGSISANVSEGYSRSSGRDRAKFYEYALGSAREARGWYHGGRHVVGDKVANHRMDLCTEIVRLLLVTIPAERRKNIDPDRR